MPQRIHLILAFLAAATSPLSAQPTTVEVDLAAAKFKSALPYSEPFEFRGAIPAEVQSVGVRHQEANCGADDPGAGARWHEGGTWVRPPTDLLKASEFNILVTALRPNVCYRFEFMIAGVSVTPRPGRRAAVIHVDSVLIGGDGRLRGLAIIADTTPPDQKVTTAVGDTIVIMHLIGTAAKQHFDTDFGILAADESGYVGLVSNAHFYPFAPLNKNTDLSALRGFWPHFSQRVSVFGGVALQELDSDAKLEPLFPIGSPVAGVGIRGFLYWSGVSPRLRPVLQPLRLNIGMMFMEEKDPNPLVNEKHGRQDLFVSVTADIELKSVIGPFVDLF